LRCVNLFVKEGNMKMKMI